LLRRTHRIATRRAVGPLRKIFLSLAAVLLIAACAELPPEYDPVTQIGNAKRTVMGWFGDEEPPPPNVVPPPGEGRPIPNLATVPPPPLVTTGQRQQRQKELTALQADQAAAAKADAALRAQTGAQVPSTPGATTAPPPPPPLPPPAAAPPANESTTAATAAPAETPPFRPNSLPPELLNATPEGAGPAPIIELPTPPAQSGSPAARGLLTSSERHGTVSFAPDAVSLSAAGRNTLDAAAASALENDGRVRLVPAQADNGAAIAPGLADQRTKALREALAGTGLPADRVTINEVGARRVDAYDVFVDY
jgi:outer membrane protein OmpA-like peptidoglycan-associated protein